MSSSSNLISVKVVLKNGVSWETSVNGECSDETIQNYFVGKQLCYDSCRDLYSVCEKVLISR